MKNYFLYFFIFASLTTINACSKKTDIEYAKIAQEQLANLDTKSAILNYKNAIKLAPENPTHRTQLAKIYANQGSILEAQKEFEKAIQLGNSSIETLIELARIYYISEDYTQISEIFSHSDFTKLPPQAFTYLALSVMNIEGSEAAVQIVSQYKKHNTKISPLINAVQLLASKDFNGSLNQLNVEYETTPENLFVNFLRGQLALHLNETEVALESLGFFAKQQPAYHTANVFYLAALFKANKYNEAKEIIQKIFKVNSNHPYTNFVAANIAFRDEDYSSAKIYIDTAITNGYESEHAQFIAGISNFKLNNIESAHQHFSKIRKQLYKYPYAENAYISTKVSLGYDGDAANYYIETAEQSNLSTGVIANIADSLQATGDTDKTRELLDIIENKPFSIEQQKQKAYLKVLLNDETGLDDIKATIASMESNAETQKLLIASLIHEEKYDEAINEANQWLQTTDKKLVPLHILTTLHTFKEEFNLAEQYANQALTIDNNDQPSLLFFAKKAKANNNYNLAIKLANDVLSQTRLFLPAVHTLRELHNDQDTLDVFLESLTKLHNKHKNNRGLSTIYIKELMLQKQYQKTINVLTSSPIKKGSFYYQALGDAYLLSKELKKAEKTYLDWSENSDEDFPFYRLLKVWEASGNTKRIITALTEKVEKNPDTHQYQLLLADAYLNNKNTKLANSILINLKDKIGNSDTYKAIKGKLHFLEGNYEKALPGLTTYYQKAATTKNALLLYNNLINLNKSEQAFAHLERHLKTAPNPNLFKQVLAEAYIKHDQQKAIQYYEELVESNANNAIIYNNLSGLYSIQGNHTKAISYSTKALELAENYPPILDSHGKNLANLGKYKEAKKYLLSAYKITSKNPEINLNLAEILIKTNDKEKAKQILNETQNFSNTSQEQKAKELMKLIQN